MSNFFKKWGPSLLAIGSTVLTVFTPSIQGVISAHPVVSAVLATILGIFNHLMPSPVSGK